MSTLGRTCDMCGQEYMITRIRWKTAPQKFKKEMKMEGETLTVRYDVDNSDGYGNYPYVNGHRIFEATCYCTCPKYHKFIFHIKDLGMLYKLVDKFIINKEPDVSEEIYSKIFKFDPRDLIENDPYSLTQFGITPPNYYGASHSFVERLKAVLKRRFV